MNQLSKNLTLSEVTASNTAKRQKIENIPNAWQKESLRTIANEIFQPLRDALGVPIFVSSGFRSIKLNRAIGGSSTSQHCKGQALDLDAHKYGKTTNKTIFEFIRDNLNFDQLIWEFGCDSEPSWIHVSYVSLEDNRCEVLKAYKDNTGRTKYKKIN
jgi:hypothetical protein